MGAQRKQELVSIVIPSWNEQSNLERLHRTLQAVMHETAVDYEVVFVDDGSTDGTWDVIRKLNAGDRHVYGIRLARNFGHQSALIAGLHASSGDAIVSMDADLQHPPEVVPRLLEEWQAGCKIVNTICLPPADNRVLKRALTGSFYWLFSRLGDVRLERGMADFRLLDRQVLDEILRFEENALFLRGIVQWVGFRSSTITFQGADRFSGQPKYTFHRMLKFAWRAITSFSLVPLRVGVVIGFSASLIALVGVLYAIFSKLVTGSAVEGWASSLAIVSGLFAILFFYLGLLGEYIGRIVVDVRRRPRFLIDEQIGFDTAVSHYDVPTVRD